LVISAHALLRVTGRAVLHRRQFDLELRDKLVAVLALPSLLGRVVADHVAASAFSA
jgi:hypothetical protein